jgi:IS30 family transposase
MIIKRQEKPSNNTAPWTKSDRKALKAMVKEGKSMKEIAVALGRTPGAVGYQKAQMGLTTKNVKAKTEKRVKFKTKKGVIEVKTSVSPETTMRDKSKDMASAARAIARVNGKRITMAMFFVEDL